MKPGFQIPFRLHLAAIFLYCSAVPSLAQKYSSDYFLPIAKNNKAIFNMPDHNGNPSDFSRVVYYVKKGKQCEIIDKTYHRGKLLRTERRLVEITEKEIHLIKLQSTTEREKNKITFYNPPKIILKVPGINKVLSWSYQEANGQQTQFVADWVKFKLNNVNTRALRITESIKFANGLLFDGKRVYYYMEGTGLWKIEGETKELQQTICEFVSLEYDSITKH